MSPLSVAQFLDAKVIRFDLIVFDEASQVKPEDALGALLRGSQLVVMGDTQQLPPTSFFDHIVDDDAEASDDEATVSDVESILHQCARSYPSKRLNWHYRSRHESLIAISNLHFYDNSLRIYPSAVAESEDLGLHFRHDPNSIYDRGKSSTNRVEAQNVARSAIEHYRKWGHQKSLGVGTFSTKQQQAILEEIEIQLKQHPEMEPFFKPEKAEHFFVKNLETIQGDERDVILVSVGYGRDVNGKLSMNFGPLNREGGQRRLNVLISRAREKSIVFANFTFRDLSLDPTSARGLLALKSFLEFAETGRMPVEGRPLEDTDSPFEDAVYEELTRHGYDVRKQVGCAGFRVDLAVVDPDARGTYLIGIECDGAKYHSSRVARDRDRLRQQLLEQLGWRIHRVWSTDWYRNRKQTVERLIFAVDEAKRTPRKTPVALDPPPVVELPATTQDLAPEYVPEPAASSWTDAIPLYQVCNTLSVPIIGEIHEYERSGLARAVVDVVRVEGPVHIDEVIRRIRTLWGVGRAGARIRDAIVYSIEAAKHDGRIEVRGNFLRIPGRKALLRRRLVDPPPKITLVSDEEIQAAVLHVLKTQYSLPLTELVVQASRALGFKATSGETSDSINSVVNASLREGKLRGVGGNVNLP
jgi:very-short-patch-repair endonuclease